MQTSIKSLMSKTTLY